MISGAVSFDNACCCFWQITIKLLRFSSSSSSSSAHIDIIIIIGLNSFFSEAFFLIMNQENASSIHGTTINFELTTLDHQQI